MNYLASKIRAALNKGSEYFKYNKNDPHEGIRIMAMFAFSHHLFVSESIGDYLNGKRLTRRKFIIIILQLSTWIFALKSLLSSYYNNRAFSIVTGDFIYLFPKPDICNVGMFLYLFGIALVGKNLLLIETYSFFEINKNK